MNIIHYNPWGDKLSAIYIDTLCKSMDGQVVCRVAGSLLELKKEMSQQHADIIDIHGCWHDSIPFATCLARRQRTRIVITPHGQLEPWVTRRRWLTSTLPRQMLYQRRTVRDAYSVIVMGEMELNNIQRLGWTRRVETIPCSLFTSSISDEEMARQTLAIFRKVMDSNVIELMQPNTSHALHSLYKACTIADARLLEIAEREAVEQLDESGWRQIEIYGHHTSTLVDIRHGADALGITLPDCRPAMIACYLPDNYDNDAPHQRLATPSADEQEMYAPADVVDMIRELSLRARKRTLGIADILQLSSTLWRLRTDEDEVRYLLSENRLMTFAARMMQLVRHFTLLPEGFFIVNPLDDNRTKHIKNTILKKLEI
ncbi:MAG: glycosyltransferase [Prevotella sp.]